MNNINNVTATSRGHNKNIVSTVASCLGLYAKIYVNYHAIINIIIKCNS